MPNTRDELAVRLERELAAVRHHYAGLVPAPELDASIDSALGKLEGARVTDFVPVLVHREIDRSLRDSLRRRRTG